MILVAAVVAATVSGCDDDEPNFRPEDASMEELTQDFDGICTVTLKMEDRGLLWYNYYPKPVDYTPYAAFDSDMSPMFFIYIKNTSNTTIKVSLPGYVSEIGSTYPGIEDLPDEVLRNFFAVYDVSDNRLVDNLTGWYGNTALYIQPGERQQYYSSEWPDVEAGTQWGRPGVFDVKVKFDMDVTVYDGKYEVGDNNEISNDAKIAGEVVVPIDMTMRMVSMPAPERKPVEGA